MIMMVPDKKMSHMLSHQLIHSPFQELLVDLWVVQHLFIRVVDCPRGTVKTSDVNLNSLSPSSPSASSSP